MTSFVDVRKEEEEREESRRVHYLPFKVEHEGEAAVSTRFQPNIRTKCRDKDKNTETTPCPAGILTRPMDYEGPDGVLTNSFRGRPLQGAEYKLPNDYSAFLVGTGNGGEKEVEAEFDAFTYWEWDKTPGKTDAVVKLRDWLELAPTLHQPLRPEGKD